MISMIASISMVVKGASVVVVRPSSVVVRRVLVIGY